MTCPNMITLDLAHLSQNVYIQQFTTGCLAQYAYYIETTDTKVAVIIDPLRDTKQYLDLIEQRGSKLKYIIETHFHADFVSGHYDLHTKTGAQIIFGPGAKAEYEILSTTHKEIIELSEKVKIQVLHTPGHTLESSCFLLLDSKEDGSFKELGIFTGDTLFLGDTGRPDLACNSDLNSKDLAEMLYDSIQLFHALDDDCIVFPGHGAGSPCGKNIQVGSYSKIGIQKKTNFALNTNLKREEFVAIASSDLPTPPQYFFVDVFLNKQNLEDLTKFVEKSLIPISIEEFEKILDDQSITIIDTRSMKQNPKSFIQKTIRIGLDMTYAIWAGTLVDVKSKVALVCDIGKEEESISRLGRVGFTNILGYLDGGFNAWVENQRPITEVSICSSDNCMKEAENTSNLTIDIRKPGEILNTGKIEGSILIPLDQLEKNLDKVPKDKKIHVLCKTGARALLTGSILRKHYFTNEIVVYEGGMDGLIKSGFHPLK